MKLYQIFLLKLCWLTMTFVSGQCCFGQSISGKIDSLVQAYDHLGGYNGIIIIGFGADSVLTLTYGAKDLTKGTERISLKDKFDLASLAKQFTGIAMLKLIKEGGLHPDDPIGKYIPELKPALQKVTIAQLANHTNGIHDFYSLTTRHDTLDKKEVLNMLSLIDTTVFTPGSKWGYSNSGYLLLAEIIERHTKMSFENFCIKHVLTPLGMKGACYCPDTHDVLIGHTDALNPVTYNAVSSGVAGLYASGLDMIAYYQVVCRNPEVWLNYFSLAKDLSEPSNTEHWNYGFGWFFTEDRLGSFRAHSGRNDGSHAYIRWYDDSNVFLCLLSNKKSDHFFNELRDELAELLMSESE